MCLHAGGGRAHGGVGGWQLRVWLVGGRGVCSGRALGVQFERLCTEEGRVRRQSLIREMQVGFTSGSGRVRQA